MKRKCYSKEIRVWVVEETMQTENDASVVQNHGFPGSMGCKEKSCNPNDLLREWGDNPGGLPCLQQKSVGLMEENYRLRQKLETTEQENQMLKKQSRRNEQRDGILSMLGNLLRLVLHILRIKV